MPKAKTRRRAALPRPSVPEQLLNAASTLMRRRGSIDIPLLDIAADAGVNVALISYYFGGREGLLLALAKRDAAHALTDLDKLMQLPVSASEKLRRHIAGIIDTFFRYPYLNPLLRALMHDASSKNAREIAEYLARPIAQAVAALLEEGQKAGEIRRIDPTMFFFAVTGACEQLFTAQAALRVVFDTKEVDEALCRRYIESVTGLFMNGYLVPPQRSPATRN